MIIKTCLMNEWPNITFEELENAEVENIFARFLYRGIVFFIRFPEIVVADLILFTHLVVKNKQSF